MLHVTGEPGLLIITITLTGACVDDGERTAITALDKDLVVRCNDEQIIDIALDQLRRLLEQGVIKRPEGIQLEWRLTT